MKHVLDGFHGAVWQCTECRDWFVAEVEWGKDETLSHEWEYKFAPLRDRWAMFAVWAVGFRCNHFVDMRVGLLDFGDRVHSDRKMVRYRVGASWWRAS